MAAGGQGPQGTPTARTAPTAPGALFDVSGRLAVVTGGTSGIGAMIARGFAVAGADVVVTSRKADAVDAIVEELGALADCSGTTSDLSSEEGCRGFAHWVAERHDRVDILVNNAGATWGAPLEEHDERSWSRVLDLNVQGVFHTTKFLLPMLRAAGSAQEPARVINVGSVNGIEPPALETYSYSASKAAVHLLTRHLAAQLAPEVTVNAIAPGPFPSRMMAATLDAFGEEIAASTPLRRVGRPDDVAGVTQFLASRAGAYLTGAVIPVDGGSSTCG